MNDRSLHKLATAGGISGVIGTLCYILAIAVPFGDRLAYTVIMLWPILSIVFAYALCRLIGATRESAVNQLAFVFAALAFSAVAGMISVQMAVRMGIAEYVGAAPPADAALHRTILDSARLIDHGMDVAWDFLIGTSLMFLSAALSSDGRFGKSWGIVSGVLGAALVVLNAITFPWPPNTAGLFDLGPFIGLYIVALSFRLTMIGIRGPRPAGP